MGHLSYRILDRVVHRVVHKIVLQYSIFLTAEMYHHQDLRKVS